MGWAVGPSGRAPRRPGRRPDSWLTPLADRPDGRTRNAFGWTTAHLTLVRRVGAFEPGDIVTLTLPHPSTDAHWAGFRAQVTDGDVRYGSINLKPLTERPDNNGFSDFNWPARSVTLITPASPSNREESSEMTATTDAPTTERLVPIVGADSVAVGDIVQVVTSDIYSVAPRGTRGRVVSVSLIEFVVERLDNEERHTVRAEHFGYLNKVVAEPVAAAEPPLTFHGFAVGDRVRLTRHWDGVQPGTVGTVTRFVDHGLPGGTMCVEFGAESGYSGGGYGGSAYVANDYDASRGIFEKVEPEQATDSTPAAAVETPSPAVETFTAEQVEQKLRDARRAVRAEYEQNIEELKKTVARHAMEAAREYDWCTVVKETLREAGIDPDVYCRNPLIEFTMTRTYTVRARRTDDDGSAPDAYWLRRSCDSLDQDGELEFDSDLEDVEVIEVDDRFDDARVVDED